MYKIDQDRNLIILSMDFSYSDTISLSLECSCKLARKGIHYKNWPTKI